MVTETCCNTSCGILFAMPSYFRSQKKLDHSWFYCPNGHSQHYPGESTEESLKRRLDAAQQRCTDLDARVALKQQTIDHLDRCLSTTRGHVKRLKRRSASGKCPCCSESFSNLAAHMKKAHAGYGDDK